MKAYYYPYVYKGLLGIESPSDSQARFQIFFYTESIGIHKFGEKKGQPFEIVYWNNRIAKFKGKGFKIVLEINKR